jgi:hypothetical protein
MRKGQTPGEAGITGGFPGIAVTPLEAPRRGAKCIATAGRCPLPNVAQVQPALECPANARKNLGPDGTWAGVDRAAWQVEENRPTPELANHRTPIENLYATGGSWHVGSNCGSSESYNCYKIIAKDLDLGRPWEGVGKEEPDSLVEGLKAVKKRIRDSAAS